MSDEYILRTNAVASFLHVRDHLRSLGLRELGSSDDYLYMAYEDVDTAAIEQWGGNVRLERHPLGLAVTMTNARNRRKTLDALVAALELQGLTVSTEEL
jgi:hypothetical protein